jgi:hypothetical protein
MAPLPPWSNPGHSSPHLRLRLNHCIPPPPFTQLSRYAPHEVATDEKKQEYFLNGLNDGLAYALEARDFENFPRMVNKILVLENHVGVMDLKSK